MVLAERCAMTPDAAHRKNKVRAAWISFVGRILAQTIGAVASIVLGVMVLTRYGLPERAPTPQTAQPDVKSVSQLAAQKAPRAAGELAIAVLPIQNYSANAAQTYFADGVTEALITELAQVAGLKVTSRTSSMAYRGTAKPLPVIARELDVDLILEGSVVHDKDVVRVTAQLIAADSDHHVWARSYDRPLRNLLPLQTDLTSRIVADVNLAIRRWLGAKA
jgi:TolB-like protein